ncbi:MAG: porin family protein [Pseudolabrys sp.]|nr:porin family protein [Pseudolabrys sp.]
MTPVASAFAADMPGTRPLPPPPPPTTFIERVSSGWYLRGDLGYRWGTLTGAQSTPPFPSPSTNSLGTAVLGGVGVGIKSDWLRTDVTLDVASSQRYRGTVATPDDVTARLSTISALFNGYLDLGSWYGFTPYIGAGVGASRVKVSDYSSTVVPITGADNSQWKFSWAGMAGLGYQVAPNMMVDLGYRYLNFGDVKTGADALGRQMTFRNVAAHEVRIGLRWSFDDIRRY